MYFRIIILVTWGRGENQMMLVKKVVGNIIALAFVLGHVNAFAASQSVTGSLSIQEIADGDKVTISVTYQATDDSLTTGLGLRLHFDSSKLSDAAVADLLTVDKIGAQFLDDVSDFDNDESTDKFYSSNWASFSGSWPTGKEFPVTLYSLTLTGASGFSDTKLNFSKSSGAVGYDFESQSITIYRQEGPVITTPADISVSAVDATGVAASNEAISSFLAGASAVDNVDGVISEITNDAPDQFGVGSTTVTFSAVDSLGNVGTATAVVVVADLAPPSLSVPDGIIVPAANSAGTPATVTSIQELLGAATATDNVDETVTITNDAPDIFPLGTTTVTFTAVDAAGNSVTGSTGVTVSDLNGPSVTAPLNVTIAAVDADGTPASNANITAFLQSASASDNVDAVVAVTSDAPAIFPLGSTVVTFSASDLAGNSGSATAIITVTDQTGPDVTLPDVITVAADNADGTPATNELIAAFLDGASASDNVDGMVSVTNNAPATFPLGETAVVFTATDAAGNTGSETALITVTDQTAPVISVAQTFSVLGEADGVAATEASIVAFIAAVTATDNVDGVIVEVSNDAPDVFPFGASILTFTAADAAGNVGTAETVITVSLDIVLPVISVPDPIAINVDMPGDTVTSDNEQLVNFFSAVTAADNKDGDVTSAVTDDRPSEFSVGQTSVTFTVSDSAGNIATAVGTVTVVVLDSDSDGLPDFYETANGLNPNDASDAESDLDGDGISNLDEYQNGTDPQKDELPPVLTAPDDISVSATGRLTSIDLGVAAAQDNKDGDVTPTVNISGPFASGRYEAIWTATDAAGNVSQDTQILTVLPLVNLGPSSIVTDGREFHVQAFLSGSAPAYPVIIPVTISSTAEEGADFTVSEEQIVIEEGLMGSLKVTILEDSELESEETIDVVLDEPTHAALGSVLTQVLTIIDGNVAPELRLVVSQAGNDSRTVFADGGLVTVTAVYSDFNAGDSHELAWDTEFTVDGNVATFDPSSTELGVLSVSATVVDNGNPILQATKSISIKLAASAPVLDANVDSDGDGTSDADEGLGDSDGDGIPDYLDNIEETYLAPVSSDSTLVMQAPVGTQITLGNSSFAVGNNSVGITEDELADITGSEDNYFSYPNGLFDFEVSGGQAGASYRLVLPLETAVPENAVFRKFIDKNIGWQEFVLDATNSLASAAASYGACPEPGSALYTEGLNAGDRCLEMLIEDGGPNDADGLADGTVTDPSGLAILYFGPPSSNSSVSLGVTELKANGSDTATITVNAVDTDGRALEGMTVTANASVADVVIGAFSDQGDGTYVATLTTGKTGGTLTVSVDISNGSDSVTVTSAAVDLKKSGGGGCTVGVNTSPDTSLILLLLIALCLQLRRRKVTFFQ